MQMRRKFRPRSCHLSSQTHSEHLFRRLRNKIREAVFERLSMLIRSMFCEPVPPLISHFLSPIFSSHAHRWRTYAGARVVLRNVDLQMLHWMSLACSLTFSCDLAIPSRPCLCALALRLLLLPRSLSAWRDLEEGGEEWGTDVSAAHFRCCFRGR